MTFSYLYENPKAEEYCELRLSCGMAPRTLEYVQPALEKTLFGFCIRKDSKLIGMGRVIGDLGTALQIVDVAVHPDYQGQKLANRIMDEIMHYVKKNAPKTCFVNLFADVDFLYKKYGFVVPETTVGMKLDWNLL